MNRFWIAVLDTIFPPRDAARLVKSVTIADWNTLYQPGRYSQSVFLHSYAEPLVRSTITEHKFCANKHATSLLSQSLRTWRNKQADGAKHYFVPIPLSRQRERERGYNQVTLILQHAFRNERVYKVLERTIHTKPQTSLQRYQRLAAAGKVFKIKSSTLSTLPVDAHIILVDDVITTGATMMAARAELTEHLLPTQTLTCLALAH